jgi:class 3 adenylate cyclase/sugar phosphate isomerase/epimerase
MNLREITLLPEVSLITSWRVPEPQADKDIGARRLPGVYHALREGIGVLDLYLMEHREIRLYARIAGVSEKEMYREPQAFLASLSRKQLNQIADWLQEQLVVHFSGRSIGRRPRWGGIATFFPSISIPECDGTESQQNRRDAVRALRAALYLAYRLGCPCIEAVGGSRTPLAPQTILPEDYAQRRHEALSLSLKEVFEAGGDRNPLKDIPISDLPGIAMEIEPGSSFLLHRIEEYGKLAESLKGHIAEAKVGLNADIAHFFLCGYYRPEHLGEYREHLLHMHLSDHAADFVGGGTHASDLVPGLYHGFDDYRPWLELAIQETQRKGSRFSGTIAVELEACHSVGEVLSAQSIVRRWLNNVALAVGDPNAELPPLTGALIVVDLGNSTRSLLGAGDDPHLAANRLRDLLDDICTFVRRQGGTLLSFTGDGFIGLVEECYFQEGTADRAWKIAQGLSRKLKGVLRQQGAGDGLDISLRCALHWGEVYVPNAGALREQAIGRDVVCTARLCDWLSKTIESALPEDRSVRTTYAITGEFRAKLRSAENYWVAWRTAEELKGLPQRYQIYLPRRTFTTRRGR